MRLLTKFWSAGLVAGVLVTATACSDLLDVKPRSQADLQTALTTAEGLDAALNGIYDRLQKY